jgi:hypothetical protein
MPITITSPKPHPAAVYLSKYLHKQTRDGSLEAIIRSVLAQDGIDWDAVEETILEQHPELKGVLPKE